MHNFYHGGGNGVNAYGGSNHGHGNFISRRHDGYRNFTSKRHNGVGNFSSYAKSYGHTSSDDYRGYDRDNSKYDYYKHSPYDYYESESLCVQNFEDSSKDEEEKLAFKSIKTINFFPSNSYLRVEYYDNVANYAFCALGMEDEQGARRKSLAFVLNTYQ
ncbi:hypothetical protein M9H77_29421 [Catharanthus roseus]|uniref:Uncharacterized protein n=1 Tax=Catharanthus roseus TaxID=4058 RepID=A0ACB9ZV55_CATRO|nr:hypothetical protein M9H77_29421 [Catharanthus roseus]